MSEHHGQRKTPGLAIASLILGILGFICCGLFSGIPAIICGHMARGKIQRHPNRYEGAGLALAGLILGYVSIVWTLVCIPLIAPAIHGAMERAQSTLHLSQAKQIELAIEQMAQAGKTSGDKSLGYPADAGITTAAELKARLIKGGYLTEESAARTRFDDFEFGNVSESDPGNTILLRMQTTPTNRFPVIFLKSGAGQLLLSNSQESPGENPPRHPAYLAP